MRPQTSPWGEPDNVEPVMEGVYLVETPGHGGLMIEAVTARRLLTKEAWAEAEPHARFLCFEEDCLINVALLDSPELADAYYARFYGHRAAEYTREQFDARVVEAAAYWCKDYYALWARRMGQAAPALTTGRG